jgi:hypothetical protein
MVKKGEYYRFTLYGCMKMEHWNQLKLFYDREKENDGKCWKGWI